MFRSGAAGAVDHGDGDFGSLSIASEAAGLERTVAKHYRSMMNSPFAGRMLYRSFKAAGLDDVSVEVVPVTADDLGVFSEAFVLPRVLEAAEDAGVLTDDEVRHFRADLEHAAEIGGFFASVQQLLVTGRKPDATASACHRHERAGQLTRARTPQHCCRGSPRRDDFVP